MFGNMGRRRRLFVFASAIAAASPAIATPYITIDLLARPAFLNEQRYIVADGDGGYTSLSGYSPATGTTANTIGFTSIITPSSVGQAYELLIRITLASQGTTNIYATGATSIINWNPSTNITAPSGLSSLKFNLMQSNTGVQVSFSNLNQGTSFMGDPAEDGYQAPSPANAVIMDRVTDNTFADPASPGGATSTGTGNWDRGLTYSGGTLVNRGNGFYDTQNVILIRTINAGVQFAGIAGTNTAPTTPAQNAAIGYFTIGALGITSTLNMDFTTGFASTSAIFGMRFLSRETNPEDIGLIGTPALQANSAANNDPIIKVKPLVIAGATPASISGSPAFSSTLASGNSFTLTNTATGASVDPAVLSGISISNSAPANATWVQTGLTPGDIAGNGGTKVATVTATAAPNLLKGAKANGVLSFNTNGKTGPADIGEGNHSYTLSYTQATNSAPTGNGTTFGTPQTAYMVSNDTLAGLSSTESGSLGNTLSVLGSTAVGSPFTLSVAWRHQSQLEKFPGSVPPLPSNISSLISDVASISVSNFGTSRWAIQMDYNPDALGGVSEIFAFNAGHLYLAHMTAGADGINGSSDDVWKNATMDSGAPRIGVLRAFSASDLSTVGTWGVDTVNHVAWAVLPGSVEGQFAVVPEPAGLGLMALGSLALLRRKAR